jgi:hypothetical protein
MEQQPVGRPVTFFGHFIHDECIVVFIEVIVAMADIEEPVMSKTKGLMNLKVQTQVTHDDVGLFIYN